MSNQQTIPGTERQKIPALNKAATKYYDAIRVRMKAAQEEAVLKAEVLALMKKHELKNYVDEDSQRRVDYEEKENVKVTSVEPESL